MGSNPNRRAIERYKIMNEKGKLQVVLTKCYYCGEGADLLLNRNIGRHSAQLEELDGKVVSMEPCAKRAEYMKKGVILVTVDDSKSIPGWQNDRPPNPHRTGGFFVVRDDFIRRVFRPEEVVEQIIKRRFSFIAHEAAEKLGLIAAAKESDEHKAETDAG